MGTYGAAISVAEHSFFVMVGRILPDMITYDAEAIKLLKERVRWLTAARSRWTPELASWLEWAMCTTGDPL